MNQMRVQSMSVIKLYFAIEAKHLYKFPSVPSQKFHLHLHRYATLYIHSHTRIIIAGDNPAAVQETQQICFFLLS